MKKTFSLTFLVLSLLIYSSSAFAQSNNEGKIVFFKNPPTFGEESAAESAAKFTGDDNIYAMAYLKDTLFNLARGFEVKSILKVDGEQKIYREFKIAESKNEDTSLYIEVVPSSDIQSQKGGIEYAEALAKLAPEKVYRVSLEYYSDLADMAKGEFELDLTKGNEGLKKTTKMLKQKSLASVVMSKPALKDAALEKAMLKAYKKAFPKDKPLRVVITEDTWTVVHNELTGVPILKYLFAEVAVQKQNGKYMVYEISFAQDHVGGGKYTKTIRQYGVSGSFDILKANIFK